MPQNTFKSQSVANYLEQLASNQATPGGGSAAAFTVTQGMALLSMVCRLTLGKKLFAEHTTKIQGLLIIFEQHRHQAFILAQQDIDAFQQVMTAYRLPKQTQKESESRTQAIQQALKEASSIPLILMELCSAVLESAISLEHISNPNVLSDVIVGRQLLLIGLLAAKANVDANLMFITDAEFCMLKQSQMSRILAKHKTNFHALWP